MITSKTFLFKSSLGILLLCLLFNACGGKRTTKQKDAPADTALSSEGNEPSRSPKLHQPLELKFYLERSGSMIGFDANNTKGEFKETVANLLNRFPITSENDSNAIYIVNDNVYPFQGTIRNFISERDFFGSTKEIGNPSYTDFSRIFDMILSNQREYDVSVLISDLIYSVRGQENVNPQKLLNEAKGLTGNVFKNHPSGGVWIIKFIADYSGHYYPYNSPARGIEYSGDRPYYAMIFASKSGVETLCTDAKYSDFYHFSTLPGYQDMFFFTSEKFKPTYSVLKSGYGKKGEYRKDKDERGEIHSLINVKHNRGELAIPIAIDLSGVPMSEAYKLDPSNYEISSQSEFEILKIESLKKAGDKSIQELCPGATHVFLISTDETLFNETVSISMKYKLPRWISQSSTNDDADINESDFGRTTFAFEAMMEGIFNAYTSTDSNQILFTLPIKISK